MEKLATYGISGAPLLSSSGAFRGFVDVPTLLSSFFKGASRAFVCCSGTPAPAAFLPQPAHLRIQLSVLFREKLTSFCPSGQYIDRETFGTEPHEAFAVGKEELAPLPTRLREDLPLPAHPPRLLSLLEQLNSIGPKAGSFFIFSALFFLTLCSLVCRPQFTKAPLKTVAPSNDGAQLFAASLTGNVHSLITSGFLAGGGSSDWSVVHRAAVWDPDTKACVAVVSQTVRGARFFSRKFDFLTNFFSRQDILRWLHARLQDGRAGDALGKATLEGLGLTPKPVFCVPACVFPEPQFPFPPSLTPHFSPAASRPPWRHSPRCSTAACPARA